MEEKSLTRFPGWERLIFDHMKLFGDEMHIAFEELVCTQFPYDTGDLVPLDTIKEAREELAKVMALYRIKAWSQTRRSSDRRRYLVQGKVDNT